MTRAWRRREPLLREQNLEAFQLVHGAADGLEGLEIEAYGGSRQVTFEKEEWLGRTADLEKALAAKCHFVANLPGRREPLGGSPAETIQVQEDGLRFEIQLGTGPHSGLFLDQRENRREARRLAEERRCLNLFCYTGSFSMAVLAGGADEVTSVDVSKKSLAWLDRNRALNGFAAERCRNRTEDVWDFVAKAGKKREHYDLIVLDPPSFGRGPKRSFKLVDDFESLVDMTAELLSPTGRLLVSLNLESLSQSEFRKRLKLALKNLGRNHFSEQPLPFDFPTLPGREPHLKSAWA